MLFAIAEAICLRLALENTFSFETIFLPVSKRPLHRNCSFLSVGHKNYVITKLFYLMKTCNFNFSLIRRILHYSPFIVKVLYDIIKDNIYLKV